MFIKEMNFFPLLLLTDIDFNEADIKLLHNELKHNLKTKQSDLRSTLINTKEPVECLLRQTQNSVRCILITRPKTKLN